MNIVKSDITKEISGLIIQGVNSRGVMGAGIALAIRNKWPIVYKEYKKHIMGEEALGQLQIVKIDYNLYIGNAFTQLNYGRVAGVRYANPEAIKRTVEAAFIWCDTHGFELKSPKIGCNLGGLLWEEDVHPIFIDLNKKYNNVNLTIFEL